MEYELKFSNPTFQAVNITCRRGVKWACRAGEPDSDIIFRDELGKVFSVNVLEVQVIRFKDLTDRMLENEHDPACRTVDGLQHTMRYHYAGFNPSEIVTLLHFQLRKRGLLE